MVEGYRNSREVSPSRLWVAPRAPRSQWNKNVARNRAPSTAGSQVGAVGVHAALSVAEVSSNVHVPSSWKPSTAGTPVARLRSRKAATFNLAIEIASWHGGHHGPAARRLVGAASRRPFAASRFAQKAKADARRRNLDIAAATKSATRTIVFRCWRQ